MTCALTFRFIHGVSLLYEHRSEYPVVADLFSEVYSSAQESSPTRQDSLLRAFFAVEYMSIQLTRRTHVPPVREKRSCSGLQRAMERWTEQQSLSATEHAFKKMEGDAELAFPNQISHPTHALCGHAVAAMKELQSDLRAGSQRRGLGVGDMLVPFAMDAGSIVAAATLARDLLTVTEENPISPWTVPSYVRTST